MDLYKSAYAYFVEQNTVLFLFGVFIISILGSSHCLVMCVPIASGIQRLSWYHFGRLIAYLSIGLILYYFTTQVIKSPYYQLAVGFIFLLYFVYSFLRSRKNCHMREPLRRSLLTGVLSGALPCGWLYLSLYLFAQKESLGIFLVSIFIFWISTLPVFFILNYKKRIIEKFPVLFKSQVRFSLYIIASLVAFSLHFKKTDFVAHKVESLMCLPWK